MLTPRSSLRALGALALAGALSATAQASAHAPVQWASWGEAAFERAQDEGKPVFVFVSAFGQQLGRTMREQTFAREETAATLNEHFVCVLVDRDEHPDVAAYLQAYVRDFKNMEGWPLNVWLTPELKPFEGASYLPQTDEWGMEGFPNVLQRVLAAWQNQPDAQRAIAEEAVATLANLHAAPPPAPVDRDGIGTLLADALSAWMATYDEENAGFGDVPRRLEPELLRFLLRSGNEDARTAALATLRAVATNPLRDPLDGGFFRYAEDPAWREPALQKLLPDQARTALAYAESDFHGPALGALEYALSLGSPDEGYPAGEDGTAPAIQPSYFWTRAEARRALGRSAPASLLEQLGLSEEGNVPPDAFPGIDSAGRNLPHWTNLEGPSPKLPALGALRAAREQRASPERGPLATSGSHGLLLKALVRAGGEAQMESARPLAAFIQKELILPDGTLRAGPAFSTAASPLDYALVANGLLAIADLTKDEAVHQAAVALLAKADSLFWDNTAGRYMASPEELPAGLPVRVTAERPDAEERLSTESMMLLVLAQHTLGDRAKRDALAASIASDIQASFSPARGDQLLALQVWAGTDP